MQLKDIYHPIQKDLMDVEKALRANLENTNIKPVLGISEYLLGAQGKRLRPALLILSARATQQQPAITPPSMITLAAAVELVHMASLVHDDVIDHAKTRHHRPTINLRYDQEISIVLGDYLYAVAFELISSCRNSDIVSCISQAAKAMCEGELVQICERDNFELLKERYFSIVKKKTASFGTNIFMI